MAASVRCGVGVKGKGVGEAGRRLLKQPRGLSLDAKDGSLLVADFGNSCVYRFRQNDQKGKVVAGDEGKTLQDPDLMKDIEKTTMPVADGLGYLLKRPSDVVSDGETGVIVLDTDSNIINRYASADSMSTPVMPAPGAPSQKSSHGPEAIKYPRSMKICEDGSIILVDTWAHRVLRFTDPQGELALEKPSVLAGTPNSAGQRADLLCFPSGVAVCADGSLLVTDTNNHRVQRFPAGSSAGAAAETVAGSADCAAGDGLGELNMPTGIAIDPSDGSFLVADRDNSRVLRFRADSRAGQPGEVVVGEEHCERPWGICVGGDGAIYVSDERRAVVIQLGGSPVNPALLEPERRQTPVPAAKAKVIEKENIIEEVNTTVEEKKASVEWTENTNELD